MSDLWEKQQLAEHRDRLARDRQRDAEASRKDRERERSLAKQTATALAVDGNLDAIQLHHDLEPEKRHWDVQQLIEEERIKLETYTGRALVETRERIKVISAELVREVAQHHQALEREKVQAELKLGQTVVERNYDLQEQQEKAEQAEQQSTVDHGHSLEQSTLDHIHAKDFKTHETDEFIRLKQTFGELTKEERDKFFAEFAAEEKSPQGNE